MPYNTKSIPATFMRGGSSKGLFFAADQLPNDSQERDEILIAAMGSPDGYGRQMNGLGGGTSSTSKIVIVSPSNQPDCDIDYLFGHVSVDQPLIDYSGNCGNLSSAVGVFAIEQGWVKPQHPYTAVRVWQVNLAQHMIIHIPCNETGVISEGNYEVAGVSGSGAPIKVEFLNPCPESGDSLLPTGKVREYLDINSLGRVQVSLVNAGNPTVFINPKALGLKGPELGLQINSDTDLLARAELIRCHAAVAMGLAETLSAAKQRPATPKLAWVTPAQNYLASNGQQIDQHSVNLCARIFSMGHLHHAFTGTGAVALAAAANIPATLVNQCLIGQERGTNEIKIGHAAGIMDADASVQKINGVWTCQKASITRTARSLMRGEVIIPSRS